MTEELHYEFISRIMSEQLLKFCRANDLPFESADELILRKELSSYQFGWLNSYIAIWDALIGE